MFRESWAFFRAGWWLALLPPLPTAVYSIAADRLPPDWVDVGEWVSLGLGAALQAALPYCVLRFIALEHDLAAAVSVNRASVRTFAPYFGATLALTLASLVLTTFSADLLVLAALALFNATVLLLLSAWAVTAPSGSTLLGPLRSAGLVLPHVVWALGLCSVAALPVALLQVAAISVGAVIVSPLVEQSSYGVATATVEMLFGGIADLIFIVIMFLIADRAGVRIGPDRTLAGEFE